MTLGQERRSRVSSPMRVKPVSSAEGSDDTIIRYSASLGEAGELSPCDGEVRSRDGLDCGRLFKAKPIFFSDCRRNNSKSGMR